MLPQANRTPENAARCYITGRFRAVVCFCYAARFLSEERVRREEPPDALLELVLLPEELLRFAEAPEPEWLNDALVFEDAA